MVRAEPSLRALEAIADEAEANGLPALRSVQAIALGAAPFRTAQPNYAHLAIAFLLWEGPVPVFSANWDECVEKAAARLGYDLPTTVTDADRLTRFKDAAFHKVHGCASDVNSLLISTSQIGQPPPWAESEVQAALSGKTVMFLGLGTVAGYVETRIKHILDVVPAASVTYVVATPGEPSKAWQGLLPDAAEQSHENATATVFIDHLLRALWNRVMTLVAQRATNMVGGGSWENDEIKKGIERIREAFREADALSAFTWMRRGCGGVLAGRPAVLAGAGEDFLLALAGVTDSRSLEVVGEDDAFTVELDGRYVELAFWPARPSGYVVAEEESRADRRARDGHYRDTSKPVLHLCLNPDGPLPSAQTAGDLIGEGSEGDLVDPAWSISGCPSARFSKAEGRLHLSDLFSSEHPLLELAQGILADEGFEIRTVVLSEAKESVVVAEDEYSLVALLATDRWDELSSRLFAIDIGLANWVAARDAVWKRWDVYLACLVQEHFTDADQFAEAERVEADTARVRKYIRAGVLPEADVLRKALAPFLPLTLSNQPATVDPLHALEDKLRGRGIEAETAHLAIESFIKNKKITLP